MSMSGTKAGRAKTASTLKKKLGGEKEYLDWIHSISSSGGRAKNAAKGFGSNKEMAIFYGKKSGGRKKVKLTPEDKKTATELYESGKTINYISNHMGIGPAIIKRELNDYF